MCKLQKYVLRTKRYGYLCLKRCIDIVVSLIGLILTFPVFITVAAVIKATSKGDVFFRHKRVGHSGREIMVYKFRTMIPDAGNFQKYMTSQQISEFKKNFKLRDDPRLTPVGRILRNTSLDELPQLVNVLKGEMSIVGPRPVVRDELEKYGEYAGKLLSVKPGITGMWQVSGRSDTTYGERVAMDMYYIDNMSLLLDMKIIFRTIKRVIGRDGAY